MDAILTALKEEKRQVLGLVEKYERELKKLPKGSFFVRQIGKKFYGYLTYCNKSVIKQDYLGAMAPATQKAWEEKMARKRKLRELLKAAKAQKTFLERALRYASKKG